jgi:hypothetical protein
LLNILRKRRKKNLDLVTQYLNKASMRVVSPTWNPPLASSTMVEKSMLITLISMM